MWRRLKRYHAALVQRGADSDDLARYGEVQAIALPWILALFPMVIVGMVADGLAGPHAESVRIGVVLVFGFPILIGVLHATGAYLFGAVRADLRKHRRSPRESPPA